LDDYAYLVNAVVDVFEITGRSDYLNFAAKLSNYLIEHFWDDKSNNFFFTADDHEKLIIRPKNNYDLSMPSGNSVTANAFLRLYHITQEEKYHKITQKILETQAGVAAQNPFALGYLLNVLYLDIQKPTEITIINPQNTELVSKLSKKFMPESIIVTIHQEDELNSLTKFSFFAGKEFLTDQTTVFVCKNFSCSLPLTNITEIENHL